MEQFEGLDVPDELEKVLEDGIKKDACFDVFVARGEKCGISLACTSCICNRTERDVFNRYLESRKTISQETSAVESTGNLHDSHYAKRGEMQTINIIEERLLLKGIPEEFHAILKRNYNICQAFKYLDRVGDKVDQDDSKELTKAENYTHRARCGEWIGK